MLGPWLPALGKGGIGDSDQGRLVMDSGNSFHITASIKEESSPVVLGAGSLVLGVVVGRWAVVW